MILNLIESIEIVLWDEKEILFVCNLIYCGNKKDNQMAISININQKWYGYYFPVYSFSFKPPDYHGINFDPS